MNLVLKTLYNLILLKTVLKNSTPGSRAVAAASVGTNSGRDLLGDK